MAQEKVGMLKPENESAVQLPESIESAQPCE